MIVTEGRSGSYFRNFIEIIRIEDFVLPAEAGSSKKNELLSGLQIANTFLVLLICLEVIFIIKFLRLTSADQYHGLSIHTPNNERTKEHFQRFK